MPQAKLSDADFLAMFRKHGPRETARRLGVSWRGVFARRERLEKKLGSQITPPEHSNNTRHNVEHPYRLKADIRDGVVLVGSDAHYWPGPATTAHRAFVHFCKLLKPKLVIMNGDALDGSTISRHPPIGWEDRPTLVDEVEACKERLGEIERAVKCRKVWTLGNHDGRFETRLATVAPEYARLHGFHLKDNFPNWEPCWSLWINDGVVVKHRNKGGTHATHNNTLYSGKSMVTGHLHSLKVTPYSDYTGTRYGVDSGTLADPDGPQFKDYLEDGPTNWRSGFVVLTFTKGKLHIPEAVQVWGEREVEFRGKVVRV